MEINHVGIIPDGGRRWAKINNSSLIDSYFKSMNLLGEVIDCIFRYDVFEISLYCLSKDNLGRQGQELDAVYKAESYFLAEIIPALQKKYNFQVRILGNLELVPTSFSQLAVNCAKIRPAKNLLILNLLIAYDPRDELVKLVTETPVEDFTKSLAQMSPVDLVIRTAGGKLLSNFLPLHTGYSYLYFLEKLFNDITIDDIRNVLEAYISSKPALLGK